MALDGDDVNSSEIYYYDGNIITQLTNNTRLDGWPQINSKGQVAWTGNSGWHSGYNEIFFYDGNTIKQLTNNTYNDSSPKINDNGHLVWGSGDINVSKSH
jgi:hypothetical protein